MVAIIYSIVGLLLLFIGGTSLVKGASSLANKLKIDPFIIGTTVVAYGTSAPELIISVHSALQGNTEIAYGNILGSNICNILLILGVCCTISPIKKIKLASLNDLRYLAIASVLFFLASMFLNQLTWLVGLGLLIMLGKYTYNVLKYHMKSNTIDDLDVSALMTKTWLIVSMLVLGIILLPLGAKLLVDNAIIIAKQVNISEVVIGISLVAFGSSVPELVTSIIAASKKQSSIALGNVIGSNMFNILGVLGVTTFIQNIPIDRTVVRYDNLLLLFMSIILMFLIIVRKRINRFVGVSFLGLYFIYLIMVILYH